MAFDGHDQPPGFAAGQFGDFKFGRMHQRQHLVGKLDQPIAGTGEPHRPGLADKQAATDPAFQILDLVRERRLGEKHPFSRFHQAIGVPKSAERSKVAQFDQRHEFDSIRNTHNMHCIHVREQFAKSALK